MAEWVLLLWIAADGMLATVDMPSKIACEREAAAWVALWNDKRSFGQLPNMYRAHCIRRTP